MTVALISSSPTGLTVFDHSVTEEGPPRIAEMGLDRLADQKGRIVRLDLPDAFACRLKAMGLFEGQDVTLSRQGNPLVVKAAGVKIALDHEVARQIVVQTQG